MEKNLLSVIVLVYKQGELVFETLSSIFDQDYPSIELIIAEDGAPDFDKVSIDNFVKENAKDNILSTQIIVQENNVGTVKNINTALKCAKGEYIKIIAGDDTYPDETVFSEQVLYLQKHPDIPLVIGNIAECNYEMFPVALKGFAPDKKEKLLVKNGKKLLRCVCKKLPSLLATQSICYTREFFVQNGLFDERYKLIEDLPMAVRIATSNIKIGYMDKTCVKHRGSGGISTSSTAFDIRRIVYYSDLKSYYENCLIPIENTIGKLFVRMRYHLICFRIKYSEPTLSTPQRIALLIKYCIPIVYYIISKFGRVRFYLRKDNKK